MTPEELALQEAQTKALAKNIAPVIEATVKNEIEESQKGFKETLDALATDIAEVKTLSKKGQDESGMKKVGTFFKTYLKAIKSGDFAEMKTMNETTAVDGGYAVPVEFHKELIRVAGLSGLARKLCTIIPMGTDTKDITTLESGAIAYVVGEDSAITASTPQFGRKILNARKFAVLVKSTQELIDDNMTSEEVATLVAKLAGEALAELEDTQIFTGTGVGLNMTGILVDANVVVVTMGAGKTSFEDITYQNLVDMLHAVKMKYKIKGKGKNAWSMSEDVFANIMKIVDTTGQPVMKISANDPEKFTLLGYPVEFTEVLPDNTDDAVSTKFLVFGAFKYFALGDRKSITSERGYSSGDFEKDTSSFKVTERVAGVITIPEAFSVLKTAAV